ncbi:KIAA1430-like protein-domain-containing protein [Tribonema minus]|uniref:KIAA1430-like protein-domain-containing protein n=1 Tax=Tribonema minus TaxID=303371 RepID=A0A836CD52_9STRA|nr:KIAA1430-like protein-domain-containing protein [Tribonema minus]
MDRGRRAMPTGNKACHERHVRKCQDLHRQQLTSIKSTIDNKPPKTLRAVAGTNAKKQQLMEDRYAQIERDNRILLEKMSTIMRSRPTVALAESVEAQARYAKSLNRESRKRELQRITRENARILAAIQSSEPVYNSGQWEREARDHERYLKNICEYPVSLLTRSPSVPEVDEGGDEGEGGGGGSAGRGGGGGGW